VSESAQRTSIPGPEPDLDSPEALRRRCLEFGHLLLSIAISELARLEEESRQRMEPEAEEKRGALEKLLALGDRLERLGGDGDRKPN